MFFLEGKQITVGDVLYFCIFRSYQKTAPNPSKHTVTKIGRKYITLRDDYGIENKVEAQLNFNGTRRDLSPDQYSWFLDRWVIYKEVVETRMQLMRKTDEFQVHAKTRAQNIKQIQMLKSAINCLCDTEKEEVK